MEAQTEPQWCSSGRETAIPSGDLKMAALLDEQAVEADRELFKRFPPSVVYAFLYYGHNLHYARAWRAGSGWHLATSNRAQRGREIGYSRCRCIPGSRCRARSALR